MHPNEQLLRQVFDTFRSGDRQATAGMFTEDAVFRYAGPGPLHGEWRGRDAVMGFWAEQDRHSGDDFQPEMLDLVAGDRNVFLLVRISHAESSEAFTRVVVYEIADGMISGARVFEEDPSAAEAFFSHG